MNSGSSPAISVVLPVHGGEPSYLYDAVRSILGQSLKDLELLVVEDPSDRPALAILRKFADERVRHILNPRPSGLAASLNLGLREARAPLIARMDADDVSEPERFELQVRSLRDDPHLGLIGARISVIDERGVRIGQRRYPLEHRAILRALHRYNCFSHPTVMFRRELVVSRGGYTEGTAHEDYDLWCRLAKAGVRMANRPEELVRYRFHSGALKAHDVHRAVRGTVTVKLRHFRDELGFRDRARLLGERALLLLPPSAVVALFAAIEYRRWPWRSAR